MLWLGGPGFGVGLTSLPGTLDEPLVLYCPVVAAPGLRVPVRAILSSPSGETTALDLGVEVIGATGFCVIWKQLEGLRFDVEGLYVLRVSDAADEFASCALLVYPHG
jgi:hypothetical protein